MFCFVVIQKKIEESVTKTEEFEKLTEELDQEAKELHKQFKQNKGICERFIGFRWHLLK